MVRPAKAMRGNLMDLWMVTPMDVHILPPLAMVWPSQ
jgi:hypothetical protein